MIVYIFSLLASTGWTSPPLQGHTPMTPSLIICNDESAYADRLTARSSSMFHDIQIICCTEDNTTVIIAESETTVTITEIPDKIPATVEPTDLSPGFALVGEIVYAKSNVLVRKSPDTEH